MRWLAAILLSALGLCLTATVARATPEVSQPVPGSPVFVSFAAAFDNQGTTQFMVTATSGDGSPLSYVWSLQNAVCGSLTQPQGRSNTNGYFHGATPTFPNGCPFAVETQTRVTVLVARTADLDAGGNPRDGAPYFTYSQVARAHDSAQTAGIDPAPALHYFGVAPVSSPTSTAATPSPSSTPAPSTTPATPAGSGFPVTALVIGLVVVGAAGGLTAYILRRRPDGQYDLVHPGADLVHPYVDTPPAVGPPPDEPPPLPPAEVFPPQPVVPPQVPHDGEDTGSQQDPSGTSPDDDGGDGGGEGPPAPLIFGPRLIDLPLGEPPSLPVDTPPGPSVDTPVEQPQLPPHEVFTPPAPATPSTPVTPPPTPVVPAPTPVAPPEQKLTKHCAPQVDDIFLAAMNRVLSRLRTLFGTAPAMADGMLFLARNGGELDFWVLNPQTTCPGPHCLSTMTLCGRCYPPHLLSDIMYGFVGGYFDLDTMIGVGGIAYQLEKWAAAKLYGDKPKQVISPQHLTEAQPAYQVGVRLGKACRNPQHEGKWRLSKDDICNELNSMNMQTALLKLLLNDPSQQTGCPPATCVNTQADTDWSRKPWSWPTPIDETQRWAVTGKF